MGNFNLNGLNFSSGVPAPNSYQSGGFDMSALQRLQQPQAVTAGGFDLGGYTGAQYNPTAGAGSFTPNVTPGWSLGGAWNQLTQGQQGPDGTFAPSPLLQGIGALTSLANVWQGMEGLDLAKDTFNFQKDAFNKNFANQVQTTNTALEDRQRARVSANPAAYQSVKDYLAKNAVSA